MTGCLTFSLLITPPSTMAALVALNPHWRFSKLISGKISSYLFLAASGRHRGTASPQGRMRSGSKALHMVPVAPACRSASKVIDSSPSNGPSISDPPASIKALQLSRRLGHFHFEIPHAIDFLGHAGEQGNGQLDASERRVLYHQRNGDRFTDCREVLEHTLVISLQKRTVVRRHHHQHGRANLFGTFCTCDRDVGAKVRCGGDDWHSTIDVLEVKVSRISRSSSVKANCSEKLARMQMPSTPCAIMQSKTRLIPSRSKVPSSLKGVGAIWNTPV